MSNYFPYIVVGITSGAIYGLAGTGLVLTYKTSGVFNFAYGAVAAVAAYVFSLLHTSYGFSWPFALVMTVVGYGVISGLLLARLAKLLEGAPVSLTIVATVGLLVAVQSAVFLIAGPASRPFPEFLPTTTFPIGGVNVSVAQVLKILFAGGATAGIYVLFRTTRLGISMRGIVDDPELLGMTGISPDRVRTYSWIIGSAFAAITGILIAPVLGLNAVLLTLLVVQAFGAAAIGRFSSLPLTFAGGLAVGLLAELATKLSADLPDLRGLGQSVPFLLLFIVLLTTRKERLVQRGGRHALRAHLPQRPRWWLGGVGICVGIAVPLFAGVRLVSYIDAAILLIAFLSMSLLLSTSGQVSLCQAAFVAVGAAAMGHFTIGLGMSWPIALLLAGFVTMPVGAVVAIPAIRLSGVYLALATFGFGILLEQLFYESPLMFGSDDLLEAARPSFAMGEVAFYYVVLAVAVAVAGLVVLLTRSRLGRLLRALGDAPTALMTGGASTNISLILVFCLSSFLAGVAGALLASSAGVIGGVGFGFFASLSWFVVLGLFGAGLLRPALLAAVALTIVPAYLSNLIPTDWLNLLFGLGAVLNAAIINHQLHSANHGEPLHESGSTRPARRRGPAVARAVARSGAPT